MFVYCLQSLYLYFVKYIYINKNNNNENNFAAELQQQLIGVSNDGNPHMQRNMIANAPNSPTSTNHNDNKLASKWIYQLFEMILDSGDQDWRCMRH